MQTKPAYLFVEPVHRPTDSFIDLDSLATQICYVLGGKVSQTEIRRIVIEVAAEFHGASVIMYIPILIHRETCKRLHGVFAESEARA